MVFLAWRLLLLHLLLHFSVQYRHQLLINGTVSCLDCVALTRTAKHVKTNLLRFSEATHIERGADNGTQ